MSVRLVSAATGRPSIYSHALGVPVYLDGVRSVATRCGRTARGGVWQTVVVDVGPPTCPECLELEQADELELAAGVAVAS